MTKHNLDLISEIQVEPAFLSDRPIEILRFLYDEMIGGLRGALVTLTEIVDGASRPLGAHMAVLEDGRYCGMVSGGCVEAAVAREALIALCENKDRVCRFGRGSPFFDIVLPCGGGIVLTIHVNLNPISALLAALNNRQAGNLEYDPSNQRLSFEGGTAPTGWQAERFLTSSYRPEPVIVLSGRGVEARSFPLLAIAAGLEVVSFDTTQVLNDDDTEQAYVFLHHDLETELPLLAAALTGPAFFIGCLGSRRTHTERQRRLLNEGFVPDQLDRIHAPIGLFGPSRDARALSVSVIAQILVIIEARRSS